MKTISSSIPNHMDREIAGLTLDSRQVAANYLFIAIQGTQQNGGQYIADAIARGATAILIDTDKVDVAMQAPQQIPIINVPALASQISQLAACFYDYPAEKLRLLGVTGTNGKTSCTHFIAQSLQAAQIACGVIGTLGAGFLGHLQEIGLTTPDAITLQAMLRHLLDQQAQAVAMEVSSHSIAQERVNQLAFETALFTNLTQDHLDYHGDMATYAAVKYRFLSAFNVKHIVINAADSYGANWLQQLSKDKKKSVYAYSMHSPVSLSKHVPLVYTSEAHFSLQGIRAIVQTPWGSGEFSAPLIGHFNLNNLLAVLTVLCLYGMPLKNVLASFAALRPIAGRMQTLGGTGKPLVVVDYSHTPDSLENALRALRPHTKGKLICVFGCGGDRDQGKRPLMAKIAETLADVVIVTNDNPRHEQPMAIAEQIMQGFIHPQTVSVELDRAKAIQNSIQLAGAEDCVLIAGKGAERYQQLGDEKIPFSDVEQVEGYWGR
ncbi:MAG TPA: UDP-N-acetylmuramoyl-L-alanyl-D-glutamate--2,6-diaminopimelate ligase [Gammaproteobacteria bacterium]|nr:UDP-N-acetylmuramoyl-L-alanyl-D-glutamate--2,6-diaminopimelate ligase [Gammaproteobacteria bacterium]